MPTHTAYAVPVEMSRIAQASPPMLATRATPKITDGQSFVKPSVLPRAVAHTASRMPETMRMTHAMTVLLASLVAHRVLIRRPGIPGRGSADHPSRPRWAGPGQGCGPSGSDEEEPVEHPRVVRVDEHEED